VGYAGYESEDSMDSFIDDGEEEDWRSELRQMTGEEWLLWSQPVCASHLIHGEHGRG
jgi:hypothetical protein